MTASPHFPSLPTNWKEFTNKDQNSKNFARLWISTQPHTGRLLFIVHGQAEQSDRYSHFPAYLHTSVDAICIFDLPGHGQSKGVRGHINSFDQYSTAAIDCFQWGLNTARKELPTFAIESHWFGHSLGGLITLRTLLKKADLPLASVCVSAPLLGLAMKVPFFKRLFGICAEPFLGSLPIRNELNAHDLSHDQDIAQAYAANPLNHDKVTPRFFVRMLREMDLMRAQVLEFPYPLMMILPLQDKIVSWQASWQFFTRLKMKTPYQKNLQSFPGFYHESLNETEKGRAFVALENWILKTTKLN